MHDQSTTHVELVCKQCNAIFTVPRWRMRSTTTPQFCSLVCRHKWHAPVPHVCAHCGKSFLTHISANRQYCSIECKGVASREREQRTCPQCGTVFTCKPSELKMYCSPHCAGVATGFKERNDYPTRICEQCGKEFAWKGFGAGRFCSHKCLRTPKSSGKRTCARCGTTFICRPSSKQLYCSIRCATQESPLRGPRNGMWKPPVELTCQVCGKTYTRQPSKAKRSRTCSPRCRQALVVLTMPRISSIEIALCNALERAGLKPTTQYAIDWYVVDLAFPEQHLAVECDGTYWHGTPRQQAKDRQKDNYLRNVGWQVLRFDEARIRNNLQDCVQDVLTALSRNTG